MPKKSASSVAFHDWLRLSLQRICRIHFLYLAAYAVVIVAYDAARVLTPEVVFRRWTAAGTLLVITAAVWYLSHNRNNSIATFKRLIFTLIAADIAMAAFNIYTQRGMASLAVMLFAIPIIISAVLLNRAAIYATAAASAAAYIVTASAYFTFNFNEGYKSQLYGEVGFYCAVFFVLASLLSTLVRFGGNTNDA